MSENNATTSSSGLSIIIVPPNLDKQFITYTDASETSIDAGIFQMDKE